VQLDELVNIELEPEQIILELALIIGMGIDELIITSAGVLDVSQVTKGLDPTIIKDLDA
jgi:hypothetical protein